MVALIIKEGVKCEQESAARKNIERKRIREVEKEMTVGRLRNKVVELGC